jgi:hypothetical protein
MAQNNPVHKMGIFDKAQLLAFISNARGYNIYSLLSGQIGAGFLLNQGYFFRIALKVFAF